jgi:lipoprotein-releasing system ATP-binding protein
MTRTAPPSPASAHATGEPILRATALRKSFRMGEATIEVLTHVDLTIRMGEFVAIEGRSGSGKSTLLHLMGALDAPDSGVIQFLGQNLASMSASQRSRVRNREFGFVFQFYHLLPELNVVENVLLSAMVQYSWLGFRSNRRKLHARANELLGRFGLGHRLKHRPNQLSGGERQRVAIARALMNQPRVLFTDEPTGNLDAQTGREIMTVLEDLHRRHGQTMVMVTHDRALARTADRVLVLREGRLEKAD